MEPTQREALEKELAELQREFKEVEGSLPRHSVKASQLIRLEELEDQIEEIQAQLG